MMIFALLSYSSPLLAECTTGIFAAFRFHLKEMRNSAGFSSPTPLWEMLSSLFNFFGLHTNTVFQNCKKNLLLSASSSCSRFYIFINLGARFWELALTWNMRPFDDFQALWSLFYLKFRLALQFVNLPWGGMCNFDKLPFSFLTHVQNLAEMWKGLQK